MGTMLLYLVVVYTVRIIIHVFLCLFSANNSVFVISVQMIFFGITQVGVIVRL